MSRAAYTFNKGSVFFLCILYVCIFDSSPLLSDVGGRSKKSEILAIGSSPIRDGNLASAKDAAISAALQKGVETYLLQHMGSKGAVNNFRSLLEDILPKAKEGVENFHILVQEELDDSYKVLVRLTINEQVIEERLRSAGFVSAEDSSFKVLFMISESEDGTVSYWWKDPAVPSSLSPMEMSFHNVFQERGFLPINRMAYVPESQATGGLQASPLSDSQAVAWGRLYSADVVICAESEVSGDEEISLIFRALEVEQGERICQGMQLEPIKKNRPRDEALIEARQRLVTHLASRFTPVIIRYVTDKRRESHQVEITLKGITNYRQFKMFKDFLTRDLKEVKSIKQTKFRQNTITMTVEYEGDRDRFLNLMINHEALPYAIDFYQTEEGQIILTAIQ